MALEIYGRFAIIINDRLNTETTVQVSDTTMLRYEQMLVNKFLLLFSYSYKSVCHYQN